MVVELKNRKTWLTVTLFLLICLNSTTPTYGLTFDETCVYLDGDNQGAIMFSSGFSSSQAVYTPTQVRFTGFTYPTGGEWYGLIGFGVNENATLTVTQGTDKILTINVASKPGDTTNGEVYSSSRAPYQVDGVDTWSYQESSQTLFFTQNSNTTVTIHWQRGYVFTSYTITALRLFSLTPMLIAAGVILKSSEDGFDTDQVKNAAVIISGSVIATVIISYIVSVLSGTF